MVTGWHIYLVSPKVPGMPRTRIIAVLAGAALAAALTGCSAHAAPAHTARPAVRLIVPTATPTPPSKCELLANASGVADTGPGEFARGRVTDNSSGIPVTYTVAPGDTEDAIAARLCISTVILESMNPSMHCGGQAIQPGQVLSTDPADSASDGCR